jgi:stearoyl-CoA desaturase (delta-9 desaturase)
MAATAQVRSAEIRDAADADGLWRRQALLSRLIYWGIHAACGFALVTGVSTADLVLCATLFFVRMFAITAGYHRYFAHRTYKTSRAVQFVLAVLGCTSVQKGPLWWAAGHRRHHQYSDQPGDMHSPQEGFWHSHQGWIFDGRWDDTEIERVPDLARYPELLWLNRWHIVPAALLALLCFFIGGWSGLVWGFAISTVALLHVTYSINSLAHVWGSRRYPTSDTSRNNALLALLTMGEGWHNNHHHYQASTRQGFFWWEIDLTYYVLRGLAALGLVWAIREPPAHVLRGTATPRIPKAA